MTTAITKQERIPGLDGLRAIAIVLIVLGHLIQPDFWYGNCPLPAFPLPGGALSIFFVLCGFLAGYYSSKISDTKSYYSRRAKKLLPTYYIYICLVILTYILLGRTNEVLNQRILYYIVPAGIIPFCGAAPAILPLVHLWFLSPIIIAYLIFPTILKANMGGSGNHCAATLCITFAILKWTLYLTVGKETFAYRFFGASQFDCIFGGLFLGSLLKNDNISLPKFIDSKTASWILWIIFLTSGFYQNMIPAPVRSEFFGLIAAGLIVGMARGHSPFKFKAPLWGKISKVSYQIYVYHILAIIVISETLCQQQ